MSRDICTRFGRYLYSTECSWIINQTKRAQITEKKYKTEKALERKSDLPCKCTNRFLESKKETE